MKLVAGSNLPMPIVNRHREEHRVDFQWPAYRLIVETDSRALALLRKRLIGARSEP